MKTKAIQLKNESGHNPTGHYVLILPDEVSTKTESGMLHLAPQAIERKTRDVTEGTLVGVGPIGWKEFGDGKPWAKVGDRVCFGERAGRDMTGLDGKRYILANCEDILAVLD